MITRGANLERIDLNESLEAFAERIGRTPDEARSLWRLGVIKLIFTPRNRTSAMLDALEQGLNGCRIAPGIAVPTIQITWTEDAPCA